MPRRKRSEYAVELDSTGRFSADGGPPAEFGEAWTPEHLVLAALADCTLRSLAHHADRASLWVEATAAATGAVFERDDGTWGFVELQCRIDATIEPKPEDLRSLLDRAERGCFVGSSLEPPPSYRWRVNAADVTAGR